MFLNLWRRMMNQHSRASGRGRHASSRPKAVSFRPRLEILEGRTLPSTVNWISGSGNWNDDSNWLDATTMTNHVPTATDDAVISVAGITVTHGVGIHEVQSISVSDSSSTLALTGGSVLAVSNGLTVNGTVLVGAIDGSTAGAMFFSNTQTIGGSGSIVLGGSTGNELRLQNEGTTVTFASTLTVHGQSGHFTTEGSATRTWVNQTTIAADVSGGTITLDGLWINNGTMQARNGGNFTTGNLSNNGTLTIGPDSTFRVGGDYTQGSSGTLEVQLGGDPGSGQFGQMVVSGAVNLAGTLTVTVVGVYSPTTGDTFTVLTYGSRNGDFDTGPNGFDYSFDDINDVMTLVAQ